MNKIELAQNPNTPQETLSLLATDEDYYVRCGVAANPNTPQETLSLLATDGDYNVRWVVALNPNTSENIILKVRSYDKFEHLMK